MDDFDNRPLIPPGPLYREARVGRQAGDRVVDELMASGVIAPCKTPTGRMLLSPRDARLVFDHFETRRR